MVQSAWKWAELNGRKRKNAIHGEEEIQCILTERFEVKNTEKEEFQRVGSMTMEVGVNSFGIMTVYGNTSFAINSKTASLHRMKPVPSLTPTSQA